MARARGWSARAARRRRRPGWPVTSSCHTTCGCRWGCSFRPLSFDESSDRAGQRAGAGDPGERDIIVPAELNRWLYRAKAVRAGAARRSQQPATAGRPPADRWGWGSSGDVHGWAMLNGGGAHRKPSVLRLCEHHDLSLHPALGEQFVGLPCGA